MSPTGRRWTVMSLLLLAGCGPHWQPYPVVRPLPLDRKTVLEFHVGPKLVRLHGVEFYGDSVSGIPWLDHLSCDTCRVRYALADVSQSRTGNPGAGAWNILIPMLLVFAALAVAISALSGGT